MIAKMNHDYEKTMTENLLIKSQLKDSYRTNTGQKGEKAGQESDYQGSDGY